MNINLELIFSGHESDVVFGMYMDSNMVDDIVQTGWNLCDCDDAKYANAIGDCSIVTSALNKGLGSIEISLNGADHDLIERTIQEYLDGLEDHIRPVLLELRSRTGEKYEFHLKESNYEMTKNT